MPFRISETLRVVVEDGEWQGVVLKGRRPVMAYKEVIIAKLKAAIEARFSFQESGVIRATRLCTLSKWPDYADTSLCEGF